MVLRSATSLGGTLEGVGPENRDFWALKCVSVWYDIRLGVSIVLNALIMKLFWSGYLRRSLPRDICDVCLVLLDGGLHAPRFVSLSFVLVLTFEGYLHKVYNSLIGIDILIPNYSIGLCRKGKRSESQKIATICSKLFTFYPTFCGSALVSMRIRIKLFISVWIRIQRGKPMPGSGSWSF